MPPTHTRDLFTKALKGKYAIGAFNVNNIELLEAMGKACDEENAPVMLVLLLVYKALQQNSTSPPSRFARRVL